MHAIERFFTAAKRFCIVTVLALFALLLAPESAAQYNSLAIGAEIGTPTGVTLLLPRSDRTALEFLGAWDLDDFIFLNAHALFTKSVDDYPDLHAIWGPGAFIGIRDSNNDAVTVGISGKFGAGYSADPFEIYIHLTPRFELVSETDFHLGGGLGIRFFTER